MANVTGVLADFGRQALANSSRNLQPLITFRPSGTGVKLSGSVWFVTAPISVTPAISTGAWTADLEPTLTISPEAWYEPGVIWLDSAGNYISQDILPWRLYVPPTGGNFAELIRVGANPLEVWVVPGGAIPPEAQRQDFLFDPISNDLYQLS